MAGMAEAGCGVFVIAAIAAIIGFLYAFDSLEYQEMGLNYSWISEQIEPNPYASGRHFLGPGNHFIKFPKMVKTIYFIADFRSGGGNKGYVGPPLESRTRDGLNIQLEVSFQYRLKFDTLYDMYTTLGPQYEHNLVRMAIETITVATTKHNAHFFFSNRTTIGVEMHEGMKKAFNSHGFSEVPFFQLRGVHLPKEFEDAIQESQDKQQDVTIAALEQKTNRVSYQTEVLKAEQAVKVKINEAEGEVASIVAANAAFCKQYQFTQEKQAEALEQLMQTSGWNQRQLLDYLKIRAVREHPSEKTTINL